MWFHFDEISFTLTWRSFNFYFDVVLFQSTEEDLLWRKILLWREDISFLHWCSFTLIEEGLLFSFDVVLFQWKKFCFDVKEFYFPLWCGFISMEEVLLWCEEVLYFSFTFIMFHLDVPRSLLWREEYVLRTIYTSFLCQFCVLSFSFWLRGKLGTMQLPVARCIKYWSE